MAIAVCAIEDSSVGTYLCQIHMALRGQDPNSSVDAKFTNRLQVLALRKRGFSAAKNLQSGLRYPERLDALPPFIMERHRLQTQAVSRILELHAIFGIGGPQRAPRHAPSKRP